MNKNNNNVKGLLKGLRYISQIFEEDLEEQEIQIGLPTDVKHVAHIGCDGPSTTAPTWMNELKSDENASQLNNKDVADDIGRKSTDSTSSKKSGVPTLPRSRRTHSAGSIGSMDFIDGSPTSKKSKPSKKKHSKQRKPSSPKETGESSSTNVAPSAPKKTRKKKSKDSDASSIKSKDRPKRKSGHELQNGPDDELVNNDSSSDLHESLNIGNEKEIKY